MNPMLEVITSSPGAIAALLGSAVMLALLITKTIWLVRRAMSVETEDN